MEPTAKLTVRKIPIGSVTEHPSNARRGDLATIRDSLAVHGQFAPIVVQKSSGHIIKGNHTHRAAVELGWRKIDAILLDIDDDRALRILLVDNRASDLGDYREQSLTDLLASLDDLTGTGYEPGDLDARLAQLDAGPGAGWEDRDARSILLAYPVAEHAAVCDRLDAIGADLGLDSYAEVVTALIAKELGPEWT